MAFRFCTGPSGAGKSRFLHLYLLQKAQIDLEDPSGLNRNYIIIVPEQYSMPADVINRAIDEAIAEANRLGIRGKETTPFLLAKVKDLTGGDSLDSNIQLVLNNARLAAKVAALL